MALPKNPQKARLLELLQEEQRRRQTKSTMAPQGEGVVDQALALPGKALSYLQDESAYAMRQMLGPRESTGENHAWQLPLVRAYQAVNPFAAGEVGERALEETGAPATRALEDAYYEGDQMVPEALRGMLPSVDSRMAGLQFLPQAVAALTGTGAPNAVKSLVTEGEKRLLPALLKTGFKGGLGGSVFGGLGNVAGAPAGERLKALYEGATDPMMILLGAVPGMAGQAGEAMMQARTQSKMNALRQQHEAVTTVGPAPLKVTVDPMLPPDMQTQVGGPRFDEVTQVGSRGKTEVVRRPKMLDDLLNPEPVTKRYADVVDIPADILFNKMTHEERAAYNLEKGDQFIKELDVAASKEPTQVYDQRGKYRREELERGEKTYVPSREDGTRNQRAPTDPVDSLPSKLAEDGGTRISDTQVSKEQKRKSNPDETFGIYPMKKDGTPAEVGLGETGLHATQDFAAEHRWAADLADEGIAAEDHIGTNPGMKVGDGTLRADLHDYRKQGFSAQDFAREDIPQVGGGSGKPQSKEQLQFAENMKRIADLEEQIRSRDVTDPGISSQHPYADALGDAVHGRPEPVTQVRKRPGNKVAPELGPEPKRVFASKEQLIDAEARSILARQVVAKDPRTLQTPNPDPIPPLPADVSFPDQVQKAADAAVKRYGDEKSASQQLAKFITLPEQRASPVVSSGIRAWESAKRLQDVVMPKLFKQLRKVERSMSPQQRQLVQAFIKERVSPNIENGKPVPPRFTEDVLPEAFRTMWDEGMKQNRKYRDDLIGAGFFTKEQIQHMEALEKAGYAWLHRDYMRYMDSAWMPDSRKMSKAIDIISKSAKITPEEAAASVVELLSSYGEGTPQQRWARSRLNKEILTKREEVPHFLRDLMGEIHNPSFVLASSMSEIERMWRQWKASETFTAPEYKGQVWDQKWSPGMHEAAIPADKKMYGEFAGKYVTPELYEAIMMAPAPKMQNALVNAWTTFNSLFKTSKVLLSPVTYAINGISNMTNMAAGGLPLWHPRMAPRMYQAAKAMVAFGDSFKADMHSAGNVKRGDASTLPNAKDGIWYQWMLEDGAHRPGLGSEAGGSEAKAIAKMFLREGKPGLMGLLESASHFGNRGKAWLGGVYDALDSIPRAAVYIEQVTKGVKAGLDMPTARARAARIVNENFVSSGNIGHGTKSVSQYAGVVNPFMSWAADNMRVHTNWIRNSYSPKGRVPNERLPGVKGFLNSGQGTAQSLNVALTYAMIGGIFKAMQYANGISDAEVENLDSQLKDSYVKNNPIRSWLPYRDDKGRAQVVSWGNIIPSSVFVRGTGRSDDATDVLTKTLLNAGAYQYFQGGLGQDNLKNFVEKLGLDEADFTPPKPVEGQKPMAALRDAYNYMKPGFVSLAENLARRTMIHKMLASSPLEPIIPNQFTVPGRYEEEWTPGQAAWNTFPLTSTVKVQPTGIKTATSERMRKLAMESQLKKNVGGVKKMQESTAEKERLRGTTRGAVGKVRSE